MKLRTIAPVLVVALLLVAAGSGCIDSPGDSDRTGAVTPTPTPPKNSADASTPTATPEVRDIPRDTISPELVASGLTDHNTQLGPGGQQAFTFCVINFGDLSGEAEVEIQRVENVGSAAEIPSSGNISVESEVEGFGVEAGRNASFNITVNVDQDYEAAVEERTVGGSTQYHVDTDASTYLVQVRVGNQTFRDWLRIMAIDTAGHVPGWSGLGLPRTSHPDTVSVEQGSGETVEFVHHAGESPPGVASLDLYRVAGEYSEEQVPMPDGVSVEVEPERHLVSPHRNYTFHVTVSASNEVSPETYWLRYRLSSSDSMENGRLKLRVE